MPDAEIIAIEWRNSETVVGFVAVKVLGGWRAFVGAGDGMSAAADAQAIANHGGNLSRDEAAAFFPYLPAELYRP